MEPITQHTEENGPLHDENTTPSTAESQTSISNTEASMLPQVVAVLVACLGAVGCGFVRGYATPAIPDLQKPYDEGGMALDLDQISWFASSMAIGALVGGFLGAYLVDKYGRKTTLIISCMPFSIGWFLVIYSYHLAVLLIGRILTGLGMGISTVAITLYISECTSKDIRGRFTACYQISVCLGGCMTLTSGLFISYKWVATLALCFITLLIIFMPFLPETPRWLMKKGKKNDALKALKWLHPDKLQTMDTTELQGLLDIQAETVHFKDFFRNKALYKPLIISNGLMFFQQFNGINAIMFYLEEIIDMAGFKNAEILPILTASFISLITTSILSSLVDKVGRRPLLVISGTFTSLGCFAIGMYFILVTKFDFNGTIWYMRLLSLGGIAMYKAFFGLGWGPVSWIVMAEIFPLRARGISSGIVTCTHWTCFFISTKMFPYLLDMITPYGTFMLLSGVNIVSVLFVVWVLPETKGKSLETIESYFKSENQHQEGNDICA